MSTQEHPLVAIYPTAGHVFASELKPETYVWHLGKWREVVSVTDMHEGNTHTCETHRQIAIGLEGDHFEDWIVPAATPILVTAPELLRDRGLL